MRKIICVNCRKFVNYYTEDYFDEKLKCIQRKAYCKNCNKEVYDETIEDFNIQEYWKSKENNL